jgi:osmotically-inducible protein OsmY
LHQRSDAEIVAAALNVLDWESTLPKDAITVTVENGWLTLEGHVNWQYFKANAERAVRNLAGVTGISNSINVIPRSFAAEDVSERIRETFERSAQIDANRVVIEAGANGTVKLYGSVHSWAEHEDAARAAYSVPGVANVENHTLVNA